PVRQISARAAALCEKAGEEFPETREDASEVIERLRVENGHPAPRLEDLPPLPTRRHRHPPGRSGGADKLARRIAAEVARELRWSKVWLRISRLAYSQGDIDLRLSDWDEGTDVACVRTARAVRARDRLAAGGAGDRVPDAPSPPRICPCDLDQVQSCRASHAPTTCIYRSRSSE